MSRDFNHVSILGRLVRDIEIKQINQDLQVANFSIANNYEKRDRTGNRTEMASFFDCEMWRGFQPIKQYLVKGKQILVSGELRQDRWEDDQGRTRSKVKLLVNNIQLLGGNGNNGNGANSPNASYQQQNFSKQADPYGQNDPFKDDVIPI